MIDLDLEGKHKLCYFVGLLTARELNAKPLNIARDVLKDGEELRARVGV